MTLTQGIISSNTADINLCQIMQLKEWMEENWYLEATETTHPNERDTVTDSGGWRDGNLKATFTCFTPPRLKRLSEEQSSEIFFNAFNGKSQ